MSIFADEWRACLREQYLYVIRADDQQTLNSLTSVMHEVGFTDSELAELRVTATLHVDDVPDDFVPDLDVLKDAPQPAPAPPVYTPEDDDDDEDDYVQLSLF
jgi:hypothetical protein